MSNPQINLTPAQKASFAANGFLTLEPITTESELATLRTLFDSLFAQRVGYKDGNLFDLTATDPKGQTTTVPQMLFPSKYAPELTQTSYWQNALSIAMQLLDVGHYGREDLIVRDHAIVKPPGSTGATPWHQDEAYWEEHLDYNELSVWMPLQTTSVEMGCMQFIPRSHLGEVLSHHPMNNNPKIIALEVDEGLINESKAVACPLPAGGVTIHSARTLHYTSGNKSAVPRRAYILTIGTPPQKRELPRNFPWNHRH